MRARASAGVGGSETCTDRDALRLLTMSEGALSRPRGRMPFSPVLGEWAGLLRPGSGARGSSRGDARGLLRDYTVRHAPLERNAPSALALESWRPSHRLRAGWQRSWKAPRHPRRAWLRLWIWRRAARYQAHEHRRLPNSGCWDGVGVRKRRPGSFLRPVRCSLALGRDVRLSTGQPPPSSSSWAP